MNHNKFTTRTELKSLRMSIKCAKMECERLRLLKVCFVYSSMHIGVPFIAPRQLGAVESNPGRQFLPSIGWRTGQSDQPPDIHCSLSGADCFPKLAQLTVEDLEPLAHQTLSGAHWTVWCPHLTVGSATRHARITRLTVGAVDRWLTGQSGALPDSPVNFSRTLLTVSRERRLHRRRLTEQSRAPPDSPVIYSRMPPSRPESRLFIETGPGTPDTVRCNTGQSGAPSPSSLLADIANSSPKRFLLFLALRHNTLVFKTMY
jgi:hypothetical protein